LFLDQVWGDVFPQTTRELAAWENQFGLIASDLTEQEQRDRLAAAWQAVGGQSPSYIQGVLRSNGFDVYIHEFWEIPKTYPPTIRSPLLVLESGLTNYVVEAGEPLAECGEPTATAGAAIELPGYALVNKVAEPSPDIVVVAGDRDAIAGEPEALAGNYVGLKFNEKFYVIPTDPTTFPHYIYIGGETFPDVATIAAERREEFETLCLKICPTEKWLGILVEYV